MGNKKDSNFIKNIFIFTLLILALISFYLINELNYKKIREIKLNVVEHPENLPTKEIALNTSFGFRNAKADLYWLEAIQYIGSNAVSSKYKKYLYSMIDVITELDPYFDHPYTIGLLLLPEYNQRYEELSKEEQNINIEQGIKIGLKGIENFCDKDKLEAIKNDELAYDLDELKKNDKFKNPCETYKIAYNLAFVYFFYKKDPDTASYYYRVAYANDDTLEGARMMAAIMKGKGGDRIKSFFMFLNMSKTDDTDKVCSGFSDILIKNTQNKNFTLDGYTLKQIEDTRNKIFPEKKDEKGKILDSTGCEHFLNKAVRELNLIYIENANEIYKKKFDKNALNALMLLEKGFINFLPTDPQTKPDHEIEYFYNEDTTNFDYR
ncbi:MAG: hypothetical protein Q9M94_00470 [Candidatus Gracilibacteria bacterium]|nr:hypothetical protein [Candidatus Gracilibacteria bacterium]MDQ7022737.1 hypothetical protein [Candidatus Gracilibacteria bacterium]